MRGPYLPLQPTMREQRLSCLEKAPENFAGGNSKGFPAAA
jgi:hypothetical protein